MLVELNSVNEAELSMHPFDPEVVAKLGVQTAEKEVYIKEKKTRFENKNKDKVTKNAQGALLHPSSAISFTLVKRLYFPHCIVM